MDKKLFGTDGIRGVAGQYPLDPATTHAFGLALGNVARHFGSSRRLWRLASEDKEEMRVPHESTQIQKVSRP